MRSTGHLLSHFLEARRFAARVSNNLPRTDDALRLSSTMREMKCAVCLLTSPVLHGTLVQPQYAGEITTKALGMDVDIYDDQGKSCKLGEAGELVIKCPFPNAAVYFWNDKDGSRYRSSYFETHPGVWTHGDFAKQNHATHGFVMLGRRCHNLIHD